MDEDGTRWTQRDEAFWRSHHEAWQRSDLDQREYCQAQGIPLKVCGNWRAHHDGSPIH